MAEETTPVTTEQKPNTTMGLLCYLGILLIVPLVAVKSEDRDDFLKTHLRQGIGLILVEIVFNIIRGALSGIAATIAGILVLVLFVLAIIGIINAVKAKNEKLPLLGDLFDKIGSSMIK